MENQQLKFVDVFKSGPFKELNSFMDGILRAEDGTEFSVNRNILAKRSPYFKALFSGDFADETDVTLQMSAETLDTILVYLYKKVASVTEENALDILFASDYLLIDPLRKKSKSFLLSKLSIGDCIPLFQIAWDNQRFDMLDYCRRFFVCNFEEVIPCSKEIGEIPFEALKSVLSDENLNVSEEKTVWNVIVRWVNHDKPGRLQFVPELLKYISFENVSGSLTNAIISKDIVKENSFCRELIFGKGKSTPGPQSFRHILSSRSLVNASRIPTNLHLIVQYSEANRSNIYITCDSEMNYWRRVGSMEFIPNYLVQLDRYVYMFATHGKQSLIFDLIDEKCLPMPPIPKERYKYTIIALNMSIYAFGSNAPIAFIFHPRLKKWKVFFYHNYKMIVGAVTRNNRIYHIEKFLFYFKVYNPASGKWTALKQPKYFGKGVLIPFPGHLFYIGKERSESLYSTVEKYDLLKKKWSKMPGLPVGYVYPQFVFLKNVLRVYEAGSDEGNAPPIYWDSDNQSWHITEESSPLRMINEYRFCTITDPMVIKDIVKANRSQCNSWVKSYLA